MLALARDAVASIDIPHFTRSSMDGYAVAAAETFGASESQPAYLSVRGAVAMGVAPAGKVGAGEAMRIATGGMLPRGQSVVVNKSEVNRAPTSISREATTIVDASTLVRSTIHFPATVTAARPNSSDITIIHIALMFFI